MAPILCYFISLIALSFQKNLSETVSRIKCKLYRTISFTNIVQNLTNANNMLLKCIFGKAAELSCSLKHTKDRKVSGKIKVIIHISQENLT